MPFIPHTETDERDMLAAIGVDGIERLFEEIPEELRCREPLRLPEPLNEQETGRLMRERAAQDGEPICFAGGGAYDHHIPAAVWEIASRGEFYTAYTPYQPEASQGTLQVLYEYQSMMAGLMGMDLSNASLYDGASALAEAVLMAVRANANGSRRVLMPATVHPAYREVVETMVGPQGIELVDLPFCSATGGTFLPHLASLSGDILAAVVIPQPNFFGMLEKVDQLTDWAHERGALAVAVVNPLAMALLQPPGQWGQTGADIACGDGQPLGAPLSSGGPYFGFLCCRTAFLRQMPGRVVGRTLDREGREGFVLTLQAREQHIRRSRATSNICTNQGLLTVAAAVHMSLLGPEGLRRTAAACHANTRELVARLTTLPGVEPYFRGPRFHEAVLKLPVPVARVLRVLARQGIIGGVDLEARVPGLAGGLLVCATECRTSREMDHYVQAMARILRGEE
ncbi:MAG: aminomethyl-transferring glycine dehydrogenase subunit GcvPA [Magnetococcales bacterium]|nr:aminomethyl-transferring glycine dehydrogenase subunit GcvPA [Magnetococcales bacterium]